MKKITKKTKSQDVALITGNPNDKVVISPEEVPRKYQTEAIKLLKAKLKKPEYTYAGPTEKLSVDTAPDKKVDGLKKLVSKMTTQPVTEEDLNAVFNSLSEAGALRKLGSIATSPVRAAGLLGKAAIIGGVVGSVMSTPHTAVAGTSIAANYVSNKLANVGSLEKDPEKKSADISQQIMKQRLNQSIKQRQILKQGLKQSLEATKQQQIATKQKKLSLQKQISSPIVSHREWDRETYIQEKLETSFQKKSDKYGVDVDTIKQVFAEGLESYVFKEGVTPNQFAMQVVNSYLAEGGLWDNIHAKRKRIKAGSGEKMRKPGSEGAPSKQDFVDAQEAAMTPMIPKGEKPFKPSMSRPKGEWDPIHGKAPRKGTIKYDIWKRKVSSDIKEEAKKTPQEKFKAGLKKAGYDPDAGAKRLTDLLAKQKKEREEHEKKYAHLYEDDADQIDESFVVSRAAGYSGVFTAADLGMKIQGGFQLHPSVMEEGGAGNEGTTKLTDKYKEDTPGEQVNAAVRMMKAKRKANNIC